MSKNKDRIKLNPGSPEARRAGCKCPVVKNRQGKGIKTRWGFVIYRVGKDCSVHKTLNPR